MTWLQSRKTHRGPSAEDIREEIYQMLFPMKEVPAPCEKRLPIRLSPTPTIDSSYPNY